MANQDSNVVIDRAQSHWSDLWKKEDYWAIWLGFILLFAAVCIFINGAPASYKETIDKSNAIMKVESEKAPFKTIAYIQAQEAKKAVVGKNLPIAKQIQTFIATPGKWTNNPISSLFISQESVAAKNAANKDLFGGGSGAGVNIQPVAFLVVKDGCVRTIQLSDGSNTIDRALTMLPELVDKVSALLKKEEKKDAAAPAAPAAE